MKNWQSMELDHAGTIERFDSNERYRFETKRQKEGQSAENEQLPTREVAQRADYKV